ncbi:MAG TPA: hypothetical protein VMR54_04985 [Thermoanaerobaculia bacterium]|nr:hypothetical protein [Thermoanaerobaculia bacterium]
MRSFSLFLGLAALLAGPCFPQAKVQATDIVNHPFSVHFVPQGRLDLRVRSGDVRVVGTDQATISVDLSGSSVDDARTRGLKVVFENKDGDAKMRISGGPKDGLTITVKIPAKTDLRARIPFGEVVVENVQGNKDVSLHAGDLTVEVGDRAAYSRVDAFVFTGEVDAAAFDESHGGLFRSFHHDGQGTHRLHAHVGAGQITLR